MYIVYTYAYMYILMCIDFMIMIILDRCNIDINIEV